MPQKPYCTQTQRGKQTNRHTDTHRPHRGTELPICTCKFSSFALLLLISDLGLKSILPPCGTKSSPANPQSHSTVSLKHRVADETLSGTGTRVATAILVNPVSECKISRCPGIADDRAKLEMWLVFPLPTHTQQMFLQEELKGLLQKPRSELSSGYALDSG